jgi:hypothetical protein
MKNLFINTGVLALIHLGACVLTGNHMPDLLVQVIVSLLAGFLGYVIYFILAMIVVGIGTFVTYSVTNWAEMKNKQERSGCLMLGGLTSMLPLGLLILGAYTAFYFFYRPELGLFPSFITAMISATFVFLRGIGGLMEAYGSL